MFLVLFLYYADLYFTRSGLFRGCTSVSGMASIFVSGGVFSVVPGMRDNNLGLVGLGKGVGGLRVIASSGRRIQSRVQGRFDDLVDGSRRRLVQIGSGSAHTSFCVIRGNSLVGRVVVLTSASSSCIIVQVANGFALRSVRSITGDFSRGSGGRMAVDCGWGQGDVGVPGEWLYFYRCLDSNEAGTVLIYYLLP